MGPEQYRVVRDAAGLGTTEVAGILDVTDRTARRWESTHRPPAEAVELVQARWEMVQSEAIRILDLVPEGAEAVILSRHTSRTWVDSAGWTLGMHAAVTRLVWTVLALDGVAVSITACAPGAPAAVFGGDGVRR